MNWDAVKPLAVLIFTSLLKIVGGALMTHGVITNGAGLESFTGVAMTAGGAFWSWWVQSGHLQAAAYLKKLTDTATQAAAIEVAKRMPVSSASSTTVQNAKEAATISVPDVMTKDATKAAVAILLIIFLGQSDPVSAQTRKLVAPALTGDIKKDATTDAQNLGLIPKSLQVTPTGNVAADLQTLWDKIISANNDDLAYASKLAAAANTQTSGIRKQCWDAIVALNSQANGLNLKNPDGTKMARPDPHLFTDVETLAEVIDNLSPQGPLFVSCAGAAQLAKTNVLTFINAAVTGAAGMAAMPIIPGL